MTDREYKAEILKGLDNETLVSNLDWIAGTLRYSTSRDMHDDAMENLELVKAELLARLSK